MPNELRPDWAVDARIGALMTTRASGTLRDAASRDALQALLAVRPVWLRQVHGPRVVRLTQAVDDESIEADASVTTEPGLACLVQTADCLPVLYAAPQARAVGAAHAGWRGLAGGVVENTLVAVCEAASCEPADVSVWFGACIGPRRFEVGPDVLQAFGVDPDAADPLRFAPHRPGKWMGNLPQLARDRLERAGVRRISGGQWCTVEDESRFFSYRRDGVTGRLASAVWIRSR